MTMVQQKRKKMKNREKKFNEHCGINQCTI
jgi:hypothetical protein